MFRPWDGTVCYIGKGVRNRWLEHEKLGVSHYNKRLAKIFAKAKALGLKIIKVKFRENLTDAEAIQIEIAFIKAIGRGGDNLLVNMTDGGEGTSGRVASKESREKVGKTHTGMKRSPSARVNMTASRQNFWRSDKAEATALRIANSLTGRKASAETRMKQSLASKGRPKSIEHRIAIGAAVKGRKHPPRSDEYRRSVSLLHKGKKQSNEQVARRVFSRKITLDMKRMSSGVVMGALGFGA